ncbi:MAG: DUF2155 domain-containing protein [Rhodospirillaceae bacterium]
MRLFGFALAAAALAACAARAESVEPGIAVLQGLDKITARISKIEAPVGMPVRFGTLEILAKRCEKRPPEETPETTAYLEIREHRTGESAVELFSGWMFASSPAVSSLEHPVYDVWVTDCRNVSSSD